MHDDVVLVVLAGGSGRRIGGLDNKVYRAIRGRPLLSYPIESAVASGEVTHLVAVTRPEDRELAEQVLARHANDLPTSLVIGGATRHQSEWSAIRHVAESAPPDALVAIHDGARPFVTVDLLARVVGAAREDGGAVPGLDLEGTIVDAHTGTLVDTARLVRLQTPQVFPVSVLMNAFRQAADDAFEGVDTAETVQRYTQTAVRLVPGDPRNLKVTYERDYRQAEALAAQWSGGHWLNESTG